MNREEGIKRGENEGNEAKNNFGVRLKKCKVKEETVNTK